MFSTTIYTQRRQRLQQQVGSGLILLLGNEEVGMNYTANTYHFRQDSNFLYYFGIDRPGLAALIDVEQDETILFGDDFTLEDTIWTGAQPTLWEQAQRVGVNHVAAFAKLEGYLKKATGTVHYLPPYRYANRLKLQQWLDIPIQDLKSKASEPLIKAVVAQRSIKSAEELVELDKAVSISGAMHEMVMKSAQAGQLEAALAGIAAGVAIGTNGNLSYPIILTVNGQILHNHHHGNTLKSGQLVLGDFGTETERHYAGDITRTFPVDKTFTTQQKEIYQLVLDMQQTALDNLYPGKAYKEVHVSAAEKMTEGLQQLGLMKGDVQAAVKAGAHALFFPHGLGHMLGLDVHDMEDLGEDYVGYTDTIQRSEQFGTAYLRLGRELEPGFVLTVEPGIYFIPELIDKWKSEGQFLDFINYEKLEAYRNFGGIRIEDNVVITENAYRILGNPIPKTIAEVEALRR